MTIQKGDVKLVKSAVMDDVPEGGGAPTANVIVDGTSNAIFPDVSESDRAAGRVSLRKAHVWVQSPDTDTYLGGNVIIAEPPNDPNVSITIFSPGDTFDTRESAVARLEAYLNVGPNYQGFLFGNHITGQATLLIFQRTDFTPAIGSSLALTKREGFGDEAVQYVRVTEASVVLSTFTDTGGDFQRYVLTLKISDPLRYDFPGFDVTRIDPTKTQMAAATKISDVVVADAARYAGVRELVAAAGVGDFSVQADGIFTQLVPSAQIETPIGDARANQILAGAVSSGAPIVQSLNLAFTTTQNLFIGGAIKPATLSIVQGAISLTDSGGRLMNAGTQVGLVDYENGIVQLSTNVFGTGALTYTVTYQLAAVPEAVTQTQGFKVSIENRSTSYVRTIEPAPVAGTLSIAYMVASKWYVLRDDGSGALRGQDSSYGAGQLNPTTGTVSITLGALPDVGSSIIYQWVEPAAAVNALTINNNGRLYWPFNTSGASSTAPGAKTIDPSGVSISWNDGGVRTVTDDGNGNLQGYGTGSVNYSTGVILLSPTTLPPKGTTITVTTTQRTKATSAPTIAGGGATKSGNLGATGITPGSVVLTLPGQLKGQYLAGPIVNWGAASSWVVLDDGAGALRLDLGAGLAPIAIGTVNYSTGDFTLNTNTVIPTAQAAAITLFDNIYVRKTGFVYSVAVA